MVAAHDAEGAVGIRELAFFNVLDPSAVHPDGCIMLGLAGNGAGVATDALAIVYYEGVVHGAYEGSILSQPSERTGALLSREGNNS
jgi:hypothetical protein